MKIGIDIRCLMTPHKTGVAAYTKGLLDALFTIDTRNEYVLYYNSFSDVSEHIPSWVQKNVSLVRSRIPNKMYNASQCFFSYPKLDARMDLDVWFSPNSNFTSLSSHVKHILTVHDLSFELFPKTYSYKRRMWHTVIDPKGQARKADAVVVPSFNTKRDVVDQWGIHEKKVHVLFPGVSDVDQKQDGVRQKYDLPSKFILFLGTLEPRKNIEALIDAYEYGLKRQLFSSEYQLVIAGTRGWKYASLLKKIARASGVKYIGYVDGGDKREVIRGASLFAFPSIYEGFGLPVLEAMSVGVPVVTSNRSSLPEVTDDAAYLCNPYDIDDMARGMGRLLMDTKSKEWHIERGLKKTSSFSWEKTAQQFLTLCDTIHQDYGV